MTKTVGFLISELQYKLSKARIWSELEEISKQGIAPIARLLHNEDTEYVLRASSFFQPYLKFFNATVLEFFKQAYECTNRDRLHFFSIFSEVWNLSRKLETLRNRIPRNLRKGQSMDKDIIKLVDEEQYITNVFYSFMNMVKNQSGLVFEDYFSKNEKTHFRGLDLYDSHAETELGEYLQLRKFSNLEAYRILNGNENKGNFVNKPNFKKEHYMIAFKQFIQFFKQDNIGALIFGTKTLVMQFIRALISREDYINFYGFLSIAFNLGAYLRYIREEFGQNYEIYIRKLAELRILKNAILEVLSRELDLQAGKVSKLSSVGMDRGRVDIDEELLLSGDGKEVFEGLWKARVGKDMEIPGMFSLPNFVSYVPFFNLVD